MPLTLPDQVIVKLLRAIFTQEGYYDSPDVYGKQPRPYRNGNPGDLRDVPGTPWEGQAGADAGHFCIFLPHPPDPHGDDPKLVAEMTQLDLNPYHYWGYRAARFDLTNHVAKNPSQSLYTFIAGDGAGWGGYCPASDGNEPTSYADVLAKALGHKSSVTFAELGCQK